MSDLTFLYNTTRHFNDAVTMQYKIELLDEFIDFSRIGSMEVCELPTLPKPSFASRFEPYMTRLLVDKGIDALKRSKDGNISQQVLSIDIKNLQSYINDQQDSILGARIEASGAGGTATLSIDRKDVPQLWAEAIGKGIGAAGTLMIGIAAIAALGNTEMAGLIIFVLLIGGATTLGLVNGCRETLQEIRDYERRKRSPFAATGTKQKSTSSRV